MNNIFIHFHTAERGHCSRNVRFSVATTIYIALAWAGIETDRFESYDFEDITGNGKRSDNLIAPFGFYFLYS